MPFDVLRHNNVKLNKEVFLEKYHGLNWKKSRPPPKERVTFIVMLRKKRYHIVIFLLCLLPSLPVHSLVAKPPCAGQYKEDYYLYLVESVNKMQIDITKDDDGVINKEYDYGSYEIILFKNKLTGHLCACTPFGGDIIYDLRINGVPDLKEFVEGIESRKFKLSALEVKEIEGCVE